MRIFGKIQKNDITQIRITGQEIHNQRYLDIRDWWLPEGKDEYVPTRKGVTIPLESIDELKDAITKATEVVNTEGIDSFAGRLTKSGLR